MREAPVPKRELIGFALVVGAIVLIGRCWTPKADVRRPPLQEDLRNVDLAAATMGSGRAATLAPEPPVPPPIIPMEPEQLRFVVDSWLGASGEIITEIGELTKYDGRIPAYPVAIHFQTTDLISKVYIVRGTFDIILDARTMRPLVIEERSRTGLGITGGRRYHRKILFDRESGTLEFYELLRHTGKLRFKSKRRFPVDSHHFVSLAFAARTIGLKMGAELKAVLSGEREDLPVRATVIREAEYDDPSGGTRDAFVLETANDFGKDEMRNASI
jgi:hypothetical protein